VTLRATVWAGLGMLMHGGAARPAALDVAELSASRPLPSARGRCELRSGGRAHDAVWLVDGPRWHLAVLGPMGSPGLIVRSDGLGVAVTTPHDHRVASQAADVLAASALPSLADVSGLLAGRLPPRPVHSAGHSPDGRGAVAQAGGGGTSWLSLLDPADGAVEVLSVTSASGAELVGLTRGPGVLPGRLSLSGPRVRLTMSCTWSALADVPATAFSLAPPPGRATAPLEQLGEALLAELAHSGRLPHRRER